MINAGESGEKGSLLNCWWECKLIQPLWRTAWRFLKKKLGPKLSFSSGPLLSSVRLFATPWTAACQVSLSITNSRSLLKLMSIESVMPSNLLILWRPLLLRSVFPGIRSVTIYSVGAPQNSLSPYALFSHLLAMM